MGSETALVAATRAAAGTVERRLIIALGGGAGVANHQGRLPCEHTATTTPAAQFEITHGEKHAVIVEVGGGIRTYDVAGIEVLQPYAVDQMCDGAHGAPLIPWPNRLGDGRYRFDGEEHQLALTEPEKHNAIHGLLRWRPWRCIEHQSDLVVMASTLFPLQGYPFALDVRVTYRLDDSTIRA